MIRRRLVVGLLVLSCLGAGPASAQIQSCNQVVNLAAIAAVTLIAAAPTGRVYVCFLALGAAAASTVTLTEGTGSTCGTGTSTLATFGFPASVTPPVVMGGSGVPIFVTQIRGDSLCITPSASTVSGMLVIGSGP